jgi:hypothetical protein
MHRLFEPWAVLTILCLTNSLDSYAYFIFVFEICVKMLEIFKIYVKSFCYWACYWAYLTLFHFKFWVIFKVTSHSKLNTRCVQNSQPSLNKTHIHDPFQLACSINKETFCTSKSLQQSIQTRPTCLISKLSLTMSCSKSLKQKYSQTHTHINLTTCTCSSFDVASSFPSHFCWFYLCQFLKCEQKHMTKLLWPSVSKQICNSSCHFFIKENPI